MAVAHFNRTLSGEMMTKFMEALDAGAAGATINFYTAPMPADTTVVITTQTLLGTCTFDVTSGSVALGTFTADAITADSAADNSGTATWARIKDSNNVVVVDVDVTVTGSAGFIQMPTNAIVQNGPIAFSSFTAAMP